ncbi:MAG: hypothetical protein H6622_02720 [Halobacteriovoraceae bacterium]|nr:hypothetical protein [Halobacteriovoraceae bacterium]
MKIEEIERLNKKTEQIAIKLDKHESLTEKDHKLLFAALIMREEENERK